jgi:hypothetical protein
MARSYLAEKKGRGAVQQPNSEAFRRFHDFKMDFDKNIQVGHGLLELMRSGSLEVDGLVTLPTGSEPWGKELKFRDYRRYANTTSSFLASMGIVRAFAAFEDFLTTTVADLARTRFIREHEDPAASYSEETGPLKKQLALIGIEPSKIATELSIYEYFSMTRNCIVHRNGRASNELAQYAGSDEFEKAYRMWSAGRARSKPTLPVITLQSTIAWSPRHAILCGILLYKIAEEINKVAIQTVGMDGQIYLAAFYALISENRHQIEAYKSAVKMINFLLSTRYRVDVSQQAIIGSLKKSNVWDDCLKQHKRLITDN